MNFYFKEPPPDIAERIGKLGSPIGKTLKEIIDRLGYPQLELIGSELIVKDEPFMCMWICDGELYPLCFDHSFNCTEIPDFPVEFVADLFEMLSKKQSANPSSLRQPDE